jgi:RNA polymerase sigma-70 factor (ECF subfamily)
LRRRPASRLQQRTRLAVHDPAQPRGQPVPSGGFARRARPIEEAGENEFDGAAAQEHRLVYQDVLTKLAKLPEEQRAVLLLVAVEDLSYAEAAKALNVPVGTVMSRLSRARRLQQEIEGAAGAPDNVVTLRSLK